MRWSGAVLKTISILRHRKKVITVTRLIKYFSPETGTTNTVGLLAINLTTKSCNEYFPSKKAQGGLRMMLIDHQGRLMYHPDRTFAGVPIAPELCSASGWQDIAQPAPGWSGCHSTNAAVTGHCGLLVLATPVAAYGAGQSFSHCCCISAVAGLCRHRLVCSSSSPERWSHHRIPSPSVSSN